ncbi:MAG: tail fiber domain-containing protein [Vicinamibacterales bacterium]
MMTSRVRALGLVLFTGFVGAERAIAQPLGTFSWQLQPYCNVVTVNVTQNGALYTLDGYDNQCGAATRASVVGTAFPNPDGTVGLGLSIVATPGGNPTHVDATIAVATLSGMWRDSAAGAGTFVFNGAAAGTPRPARARSAPLEIPVTVPTLPELQVTGIGLTPDILGVRSGGSPAGGAAATLQGDTLLRVDGAGHDGAAFTPLRVGIEMAASENWAFGANGTTMHFRTTQTGNTAASIRMTIANTGRVGIGTQVPANLLDVSGDIRIGTGLTGCVLDNDGTVIAGVCGSDARFKRDVSPFGPVLDKLTDLRPVHFYWRSAHFPAKAFGDRQSYGLVAQDVEQVLPELVTTDAEGYKAVNYSKLPLLAIQAIKELRNRNDSLAQRLATLEARLDRVTGGR